MGRLFRISKKSCKLTVTKNPMNITEMYSVFTFYNSIDEIVDFCEPEFVTYVEEAIFNRGWQTNRAGGNFQGGPKDGILGKFFHLSFTNKIIEDTYGWFGVYFCHENPEICIAFFDFEDCGGPVFNQILSLYDKGKCISGKYSSDAYVEEKDEPYTPFDPFFFDFIPPDEFDSATLEKQKEILREFFKEVILCIYNTAVTG